MSTRTQLEQEATRLRGELAETERAERRIPSLLITTLFAIPAWVLGGLPAAALVVVAALLLTAIATYQVEVRKHLFQGEIDDVREELDSMPPPRKEPERAPTTG